MGPVLGAIYRLIPLLVFKTPAQGAHSTLFAAASAVPRAEPDKYRGAYLTESCKVKNPSQLVQKAELRRELWDTTETFLRDNGLELPPT